LQERNAWGLEGRDRYPSLRIVRGQCIEGFGGKEAYYPMLEALGALLQGDEENALVQLLAKRAPTWLIQFPSLVKAEQRESGVMLWHHFVTFSSSEGRKNFNRSRCAVAIIRSTFAL
jgi:hypothetical protein